MLRTLLLLCVVLATLWVLLAPFALWNVMNAADAVTELKFLSTALLVVSIPALATLPALQLIQRPGLQLLVSLGASAIRLPLTALLAWGVLSATNLSASDERLFAVWTMTFYFGALAVETWHLVSLVPGPSGQLAPNHSQSAAGDRTSEVLGTSSILAASLHS